MQDAIQASLYPCSSTDKDLTTADAQRVHHYDAVLIKENESDQGERVTAIQKIRETSMCKET